MRSCTHYLAALLCALTGAAHATGPDPDVFPIADLLNPVTASREQCEQTRDAVWVETEWRERAGTGPSTRHSARGCIRYFPSPGAEQAQTALLFIHGDAMSPALSLEQNQRNYEKGGSYKAQVARASRTSKDVGLAVIRIARPGVFGSTGLDHMHERRLPDEAHLVDAAVTAIKERYGYSRIQLAGLSGGGGLVGALLTLGRTDIDCAVVGSGVVSVKLRSQLLGSNAARHGYDQTGQKLSQVYDPIDHVRSVKPDAKRRIFVVGDPLDQAVAFESQAAFQERLFEVGIPATLLQAKAVDATHHDVANDAQRVAGWCMAGLGDAEIQARLKGSPAATPAAAQTAAQTAE